MATEGAILVQVGMTVKNPPTTGALANAYYPSKTLSITQNTAAPCVSGGTQTIDFAAHEALVVTGLTTLGVAWFENMDDTNFVEIGVDVGGTFYPFQRINPGEAWPIRLSQSATVYAKADTAEVILKREIHDD